MKNIKKYVEFLNENIEDDSGMNYFLSELIKLNRSSKDIINFRDELKKLELNENLLNENLLNSLSNWLNDKLIKFLIKRKKNFYTKLIDKLSIFDLTTLDDTFEHYPTFTRIRSLYLAGGMDEAPGSGKGWRLKLEKEFGEEYVIDGSDLNIVLKNPKYLLNFELPALLNPIRKEMDRSKDDEFDTNVKNLKDVNYDPITQDNEPIDYIRRTFTKNIEPDDENLLRISDAIFLGMDRTAGAGTYGELELLSLSMKPLFCWLVNLSEGLIGEVKLWTIPHLSKVMLNEDDMKVFVKTLKDYS